MKLIDAISKNAHAICGTRGQGYGRLRQLYGDRFYNVWDDIYGLFDVELLQLGRYAQSIQNSETDSMVSRIATTIPEKRKAQTSGFLIQFSPEKNGRVGDGTIHSSPLHLLDRGSSNNFFSMPLEIPAAALIDTDHQLQSSKMTEVAGRKTLYHPLLKGQSPPIRNRRHVP